MSSPQRDSEPLPKVRTGTAQAKPVAEVDEAEGCSEALGQNHAVPPVFQTTSTDFSYRSPLPCSLLDGYPRAGAVTAERHGTALYDESQAYGLAHFNFSRLFSNSISPTGAIP